jgi:hypothetical protein
VVRAVDSAGNEDANTVQVTDKPTGALTVHYSDDFEGATGWAHQTTGSTATTGAWIVGDPVGTNYQPEDDHTAGAGTKCFYTAANPAGADGTDDVDGGLVIGTSPVINTSAVPASGVLEFWYFNGLSVANANNFFKVDLSSNGGSSYTTNIINNNNTTRGNAWTRYSAPLTIFNANFRIRLQAQDSTGSIVEAGIDDVRIYSSASCATGAARPGEVTATGKGSTAGTVVLNFADMAGATGYNVYEGALPLTGGAYSHGTTGNVCAAATTLAAGRRSTAAAGIGTAGSHYYLVTQYTTVEGPSGFNSSSVEIDPSKSTCAP